jgi:DNA invertase Pin-like site-specific DNA recombinase
MVPGVAGAAGASADPDDPSRKLIRQILGAVNESERSIIKLRLRSGRARKSYNGGYA